MQGAVPLLSLLFLLSLSLNSAQCPYNQADITKWSEWPNRPTQEMDNVTIPAGLKVVLDGSPGFKINKIDVYGELIFDDKDIQLDVYYLLVYLGGHLWVGSETCPLTKKVTISLWGDTQNPKTQPMLAVSNKVIGAFAGGKIDVHGTPPNPTWTVLSGTVAPGATSIVVDDNVSWQVGDLIVIATTDFTHRDDTSLATTNDPTNWYNDFMDERRVITNVEVTGSTSKITFEKPLQYLHWGDFWRANDGTGNEIDMRAEVALLTRNVVIRGDISEGTAAADKWGGHIMVEGDCSLRIAGAELYYMGQKDNVARYPIHYHLCGDCSTSYVRDNAIYDTFQRCVTIHGSDYIKIENNVGFNSSGHCYFIEDGNEIGNVFDHNLGIRANPHTLLQNADLTPAVFWVTSPNNTFTNNVAVGGHFGYWFSFPVNPLAFGALQPNANLMFNRLFPVPVFKGNKGHSATRKCLHFDDGLQTAAGKTEMFSYTPSLWNQYISPDLALQLQAANVLTNQISAMPPTYVVVEDFTGYKCIEHAIWGRGNRIYIKGAKLADNQIGAQFPGDGHIFEDSFIVGETDNVGTPKQLENEQGRSRFYRWSTDTPIIGYRGYDFGQPNIVRNVRFYNFKDFAFLFNGKVRKAGGLSVQGGHGVLTPRQKNINLGFINTPNHVYFSPSSITGAYRSWEPNFISAALVDTDGSLTGSCGSSIVYPSPMLYTSACKNYSDWNAFVCPPGHAPHRWMSIVINDNNGNGVSFPTTLNDVDDLHAILAYRLPDLAQMVLMPNLANYNPDEPYSLYLEDVYVNILTYNAYLFKVTNTSQSPSSMTVRFRGGRQGEFLRFAVPYPSGTTFTFTGNWIPVSSYDQLGIFNYYYDDTNKLLWVHLEAPTENYRYDLGIWTPDVDVPVTWIADCSSSGSCTQQVDPAQIDIPAISTPPGINLCEASGNVVGGDVSLSPSGKTWVLFDEEIDVEWTIAPWTKNWIISNEDATSGSNCLEINLNRTGFYIYITNAQKVFPANEYTHLTFKIRALPGRGRVSIGVGAGNSTGDYDNRFFGGSINNPNFKTGFPVDDTKWQFIAIPLSFLGLGDGENLNDRLGTFRWWPASWDYIVTQVLIDEITLANYDVGYNAQSMPTGNINYGYVYTPGSEVNEIGGGGSSDTSNNGAWAVPVVVILVLIVVGLIAGVVYLKFFSNGAITTPPL